MSSKVAIVYLSYNSKEYLPKVLKGWQSISYPKDQVEIIIVDNNSEDGSVEWIKKHIVSESRKSLPPVTFLPQAENTMFARGNNIAIEHAILSDADYIYLHNNDLRIEEDTISEAVALAESDSTIGSVQSLMLLWQKEKRVNSTGGMVHIFGYGFVRDNGQSRKELDRVDGEDIFYGSGAATLYKTSVLREVGLLDEHLTLYHEDLELGWRIRLHGYRNVLSMKSIAYHKYEFSRSVQKFFWMERNRVLVMKSMLKWQTLLLLWLPLLINEIAANIFAIKGGYIKEKLLAYVDLMKPSNWAYILRKRKEVAALRKVGDKEITYWMTSVIAHQETKNPIVEYIANPLITLMWKGMEKVIKW